MKSAELIDRIERTLLYEGYILFPYRSAMKNRQRWTFGVICPRPYSEAQGASDQWRMQAQCILVGSKATSIQVHIRFLHLLTRTLHELQEPPNVLAPGGDLALRPAEALEVDRRYIESWEEADERKVTLNQVRLDQILLEPQEHEFKFPHRSESEVMRDPTGRDFAILQRRQESLHGSVEVTATQKGSQEYLLSVRIFNLAPLDNAAAKSRDEVMPRSLVATHSVLEVDGGEFISLTDPPPGMEHLTAECHNLGTWPVLVGQPGDRHTLLASPIILYDYPQIAPESVGDLFDATEVDELLTLNILSMTDAEKRQMVAIDHRAEALLARTQALGQSELMRLHGTFRELTRASPQQEQPAGVGLKPGDRVRLWPQGRSDIFDLVLRGKTAIIERIERDYDNRTHLAVSVEEDPGIDFARAGKPAHRFFFSPEEVEFLSADGVQSSRSGKAESGKRGHKG